MSSEYPRDSQTSCVDSTEGDGQVKISLVVGKDTLDRLDSIVRHGGFGGRGRALDSLLESMEEIMTNARGFWNNFNQTNSGDEWTDADSRALRSALIAASLAFTKMERFYGWKENQARPTAAVRWPPQGAPGAKK